MSEHKHLFIWACCAGRRVEVRRQWCETPTVYVRLKTLYYFFFLTLLLSICNHALSVSVFQHPEALFCFTGLCAAFEVSVHECALLFGPLSSLHFIVHVWCVNMAHKAADVRICEPSQSSGCNQKIVSHCAGARSENMASDKRQRKKLREMPISDAAWRTGGERRLCGCTKCEHPHNTTHTPFALSL